MAEDVSTSAAVVKCACASCHCAVQPERGVARDGKLFCSQTCAYDCSEVTCVCVHEHCGKEDATGESTGG